jgi:type VII secretion protein EccE
MDIDGQPVGVIDHAGGVTALLEPAPTDTGLVSEHATTLPSPVSLLPFAEVGDPVVTAQVVLHSVAPLAGSTAPGASYQELTAGRVPAQRRAWIALQIMRTVDGYSEDDLRQALSSALRRLRRRLDKDGTPVRALDRAEAAGVLAKLAHIDSSVGPGELREGWNSWTAAGVPQVCFRIRQWPDLAEPAGRELIDRLATIRSRATTVALATRRARDEIEVEAVIRVAADDPRQLDAVADALESAAASCGATLDRLNGEHVHGVAASLPLGGFLP